MVLINSAQSGNVFWQVGSSATLGTVAYFAGNLVALDFDHRYNWYNVELWPVRSKWRVTLDSE